MADSGRLERVVGIDAEGAFRPMSARRLLVLGGIGLILVGMLFGDIFAVFVLHQNAAKVGEPHTVTFVTDNKTKAPLSAPFAVKNSSSFMAIPPGSNSAPVLLPNHHNPSMTMILASNSRASSPTVIDSTGKAVHLGPNPIYSVKGNEKFISSTTF